MSETPHNLRTTNCFITTHDETGNSVFYDKPEEVAMKQIGPALFSVLFTTSTFPHDFTGDQDVESFLKYKGIVPISMPNGTVVRIVDLAPGESSPMHRTTSLDYGVVLEGEVQLILDDIETGPRRLMKRGDVSVQRATNHAWRNPSKDAWSRMLYVLVDAKPIVINGKVLSDRGVGEIHMPEQ
jgi:quercetin dioxygenase-like cupin family protein